MDYRTIRPWDYPTMGQWDDQAPGLRSRGEPQAKSQTARREGQPEPHPRLAWDGEPCLVPEGRLKSGTGTDLNQSGMPELCVPLRPGGLTEGARRPRRRTQKLADPGCPLPAAASRQWI